MYWWQSTAVDDFFPLFLVPHSTACIEIIVAAVGLSAAMLTEAQRNATTTATHRDFMLSPFQESARQLGLNQRKRACQLQIDHHLNAPVDLKEHRSALGR